MSLSAQLYSYWKTPAQCFNVMLSNPCSYGIFLGLPCPESLAAVTRTTVDMSRYRQEEDLSLFCVNKRADQCILFQFRRRTSNYRTQSTSLHGRKSTTTAYSRHGKQQTILPTAHASGPAKSRGTKPEYNDGVYRWVLGRTSGSNQAHGAQTAATRWRKPAERQGGTGNSFIRSIYFMFDKQEFKLVFRVLRPFDEWLVVRSLRDGKILPVMKD